MQFRLVCLVVFMLLQACAVNTAREELWPSELPAQGYFEDLYRKDLTNSARQSRDEYLLWVIRFYQGSELYPNGWNSVTQSLLLGVKEPELANDIKEKMQRLGLLISGEWAKNNHTRMINTRHVSIWGNAILKSSELGETLALIGRVTEDVEDLLAQRISPDIITESRFYPEEDIFKSIN